MEQEPVVFRATIVEPTLPPPPSPLEPIPEEKPAPMPSCCLPEPEHPFERFERQSELADALPSIFIGIGVAYAIGILTGFVIFSSPSIYLE